MLRRLLMAGALALMLAVPAAAQDLPPAVQKVYEDFGQDGAISPCKHTVSELERTKSLIPPDIDQYAPDFPPAVDAALEAHARGDCAGKKPDPAPPVTAPVTPSATPAPTAVPMKTVVEDPPEPEDDLGGAAAPAGPAGPPTPDAEIVRAASAEPANSAPAPVWMLVLLAGLAAAAGLFVLVARRTRRGTEALARFRHSWAEARWRSGGAWMDFADWVRTGR